MRISQAAGSVSLNGGPALLVLSLGGCLVDGGQGGSNIATANSARYVAKT